MSSMLVPAPTQLQVVTSILVPASPFHHLVGLSRQDLVATRDIPAAERRLLVKDFLTSFRWEAIKPHLPLRLGIPADVPPGNRAIAAPTTAGWPQTTSSPAKTWKDWTIWTSSYACSVSRPGVPSWASVSTASSGRPPLTL